MNKEFMDEVEMTVINEENIEKKHQDFSKYTLDEICFDTQKESKAEELKININEIRSQNRRSSNNEENKKVCNEEWYKEIEEQIEKLSKRIKELLEEYEKKNENDTKDDE